MVPTNSSTMNRLPRRSSGLAWWKHPRPCKRTRCLGAWSAGRAADSQGRRPRQALLTPSQTVRPPPWRGPGGRSPGSRGCRGAAGPLCLAGGRGWRGAGDLRVHVCVCVCV
jgi:hypothetical protein